jgi:hypothetical protein
VFRFDKSVQVRHLQRLWSTLPVSKALKGNSGRNTAAGSNFSSVVSLKSLNRNASCKTSFDHSLSSFSSMEGDRNENEDGEGWVIVQGLEVKSVDGFQVL